MAILSLVTRPDRGSLAAGEEDAFGLDDGYGSKDEVDEFEAKTMSEVCVTSGGVVGS